MTTQEQPNNLTPKVASAINSLVQCIFSTGAPGTTARNSKASIDLCQRAGAVSDAARVYNRVVLAKGTPVGQAISLLNMTASKIRRLGLPIRYGGIYLPVRKIPEARNLYDDCLNNLDILKDDIISAYPDIIKGYEKDVGAFASEIHIPTATEVASRFYARLTIMKMPTAVSALDGLVGEVADRVRAESAHGVSEMLREAHAGPLQDLRDQLAEFSSKLRHAQRFHRTQFDKLRDEVHRVSELNVLDLPEINKIVKMTRELAVDPIGEFEQNDRVLTAQRAEKAIEIADETLAAMGL